MRRLAVLAVVLAGCDVMFGFEDVTLPPELLLVTGTYRQRYVTNGEDFAPVLGERIYPPGTISFAVTLDDGTQPQVTYKDDGTFSFAINEPGQSYRFDLIADGQKAHIEQHAPRLEFLGLVAGRPDRLPIVATTVQFTYPMSTGTNKPPDVFSTGIYTRSHTGQFGPTVSFDWRLATPAPGAMLGLLEASRHDQIFAVEPSDDVTTVPETPYSTIKGISRASITQALGTTIMIPSPQLITRNTCVRFIAPNDSEAARIMAAVPRTYTRTLFDWAVFMTPSPDQMGLTGALAVANASGSPARNLDVAPTFYDPFTGMTPLVETGAVAAFNVQLPGGSALEFSNVNRRYAVAERGVPGMCTSTKTTLTAGVALAGVISLDGAALDTDGKVVSLDLTRDVPASWTISDGPVDGFSVSVHELQVVNGATTSIVRDNFAVAGQTHARLPASLFEPGKTYIIAITSARGRPNILAGDWATLMPPFENGGVWSYYFEVAAR